MAVLRAGILPFINGNILYARETANSNYSTRIYYKITADNNSVATYSCIKICFLRFHFKVF